MSNDAPVWPWVLGAVAVAGGITAAVVLVRRGGPPPDFVDPPPGPTPSPGPAPPPYPLDLIDTAILSVIEPGQSTLQLDQGTGETPNDQRGQSPGLPYHWRVFSTDMAGDWEFAAVVVFYDGARWRFWGNDPDALHLVGRGSESSARLAITMWADSWSAFVDQ